MSIAANFPTIRPTLNLDFVNSRTVDPRITFTRASTATYYDGRTFAKAEENLLTRSQEFNNAVWVKASASVTANTGAAPDGTTTADTLTASGPNGSALQTFTALAQPYTFSLWVRRTVGTGTVEITVDGSTWSAITITGTWARFSTTVTPSDGSRTAGIRLATNGDAVEIWGAQLEQRSSVTAYTPTTDQPITRYQPVLMTAAANTPRIDFDPVTGECRGLLIEEQRTNLLLRSSEFDDAYWTKNNSTVTANAAVAPDGTLTADKLVDNTTNGVHGLTKNMGVISPGAFSVSCYAKAGEGSRIVVYMDDQSGLSVAYSFNLSTGAVVQTKVPHTSWTSVSATATPVGNGWYRCSISGTTTNTTLGVRFLLDKGTTYNAFGLPTDYTGDGYSGIYIWGAQLEAGAFPTSYIPTTTAQVTRSADSAVMRGANFSSWYRQDEGTFLTTFSRIYTGNADGSDVLVSADDGSGANQIQLRLSADTVDAVTLAGGSVQADAPGIGVPGTEIRSSAFAYKTNDFAFAYAGTYLQTDTSGVVPPTNRLGIGTGGYNSELANSHIRRIAYWPARLSNAQLQAITA